MRKAKIEGKIERILLLRCRFAEIKSAAGRKGLLYPCLLLQHAWIFVPHLFLSSAMEIFYFRSSRLCNCAASCELQDNR